MGIDFESLVPAKSLEVIDAEKKGMSTAPKEPRHNLHKIKKHARARLIAQEYVRNGMNLRNAIATVTGSKSTKAGNGILTLMGDSTDTFVEELKHLINNSDISKDRALNLLWAMVNTSIIDFIDDNGHVLPIAELRKLPRVMQVLLSKIDVTTTQHTVRDEKGKVMKDDNGSPYLSTEQRVKIELPEKMVALNQLAQIMRWVGPTISITNTINIGRMMSDADARMQRANVIYEQAKELDE
jgi:hypothetical protein